MILSTIAGDRMALQFGHSLTAVENLYRVLRAESSVRLQFGHSLTAVENRPRNSCGI